MVGIVAAPFSSTPAFKALQLGSKFLLPAGVPMAALGTSTTQRNHTTTTSGSVTLLQAMGYGGMICLRQRDPRFDFTTYLDPTDSYGRGFTGSNYGRAGQTNAVLASMAPSIIARGYKAVVLQLSQNDLLDTTKTITDIISGVLTNFILPFKAAGTAIYLVTPTPRAPVGNLNNNNVAPVGNFVYRKTIDYRRALMDLAEAQGCEIIDTYSALVDPTSTYGAAKQIYSEDGLHLTPQGAWVWSGVVEAAFRRTILPGSAQIFNAAATGNLYSNGLLSGTAGQLAGTTNSGGAVAQSGTLPDKVRVGAGANLPFVGTCATTIVQDSEQGNALRQTYTFTNADGSVPWRTWFTDNPAGSGQVIAGAVANQWVRAYVRVFIESGGEMLQNLALNVLAAGATGNSSTSLLSGVIEGASAQGLNEPVGDASLNQRSIWLISEPMLCPATATGASVSVEVWAGGTGTTILELSRPALRIVSSPVGVY